MEQNDCNERCSGKAHITQQSSYLNHRLNGKEKNGESDSGRSEVDQRFASSLSVSSNSSYASVITSSQITEMQSVQEFDSVTDPRHVGSTEDFEDFKSPESSIIEHYYNEYAPVDCDAGNLLTDTEIQCKVHEYEAEQMYGSSEVDSDVDNKLYVQNMKNCEYEIYRTIHSKNRYNSNSSNNSSYIPTDLESVSDTTKRCFGENTRNKQLALYNGCFNNKTDRQKCALKRQKSFSRDSVNKNSEQVGCYRQGDAVQPVKTNHCESLKRITITISTKQTSEVSNARKSQKIISDSDGVTDSTDDLTDTESLLSFQRNTNVIAFDQSSYVTSTDLSDKESESFQSSRSVSDCKKDSESDESKYFDCSGDLDGTVLREKVKQVINPKSDMDSFRKYRSPRSSSSDSVPIKVPPRRSKEASRRSQSSIKTPSDAAKPMIHIVQELSQNRTISSTVSIDKEQIKVYREKRNEKKSEKAAKIIDDDFCDEILSEAFKLSLPSDNENGDSNQSNGIRSHKKYATLARVHSKTAVLKTEPKTVVKDEVSMGRLVSGPKYTGKLIGDLLSKRLDRAENMSSVRRSMLQNLTFTVKESNLMESQLTAIPPIKPPRSFTASSASSPKSKQSVTSTATIPIEELQRNDQMLPPPLLLNPHFQEIPREFQTAFLDSGRYPNNLRMGWVPPTKDNGSDSRTGTYLGWVQPTNESSTPLYLTQSNQRDHIGFRIPKENIDTVDNAITQDFERFSANLNESPHNHLSTPIKDNQFDMQRLAELYDLNVHPRSLNTTNNQMNSSSICDKCLPAEPESEPRCQQCNGKIKRSPKNSSFHFLSSKKGKKIGLSALKRTKTIIGASKHFLVRPKAKKDNDSSGKNVEKRKNEPKIIHLFDEPTKDLDDTARFNSNTYSSHNYQKTVDKYLDLSGKHDNVIAMLSNPEIESRKRIDENFHKFPPSKPIRRSVLLKRSKSLDTTGNSVYATPNATFNFDRVVVSPAKPASEKKSPSKFISTLRVLAKPPKRIFFGSKSSQFNPKSSNERDAQHFYRSYQGNAMEQKVPLISELLMSLKQNVEEKHETEKNRSQDSDVLSTTSSSAKRKLFDERMSSTEDMLDDSKDGNQVTEVELHDEPEPLYAEISPLKIKEQKLGENGAIDVQHITIYKKPNVVYAVVNRNRPKIVNIVEKSGNTLNNSVSSTQSYESLNLSVVNDFAQSVQNLIQQQTNDGAKKRNSDSQQSGSPISDASSGCSAFDLRKFQKFGSNPLDRMESDVVSSQSGSYCESLARGNDLNGEIKTFIKTLESIPSDFRDSEESFLSQERDHEYILVDDRTKHEKAIAENGAKSDDSLRNGETALTNSIGYDTIDGSFLNASIEYATPLSIRCSDSEASKKTPSWSSSSKDSSPNYKAFNKKLRNSIRKGKDYFRNSTKKLTNHFEKSEKKCDKNDSLDAIQKDNLTPNQRKQINQIFELLRSQLAEVIKSDMISKRDESLIKVINKISRQQEVRHQLRNALHICRATKEFQQSTELVESERLMLISHLKEWAGKLELVRISALKDDARRWNNSLTGALAIRQLEFFLNQEVIYDTHFNHFYMCVCSYRDQVECTSAKERNGNRVVFNDCLLKFTDIEEDFEIRIDVHVLRLRKNVCQVNGDSKQKPNKTEGKKSLNSSPSNSLKEFDSDIDLSRFRIQASSSIARYSLFFNKRKLGQNSPRKASNGSFVFSVSDSKPFIVTPCSRNSNLKQCIQVTYECLMSFEGTKLSGFLNMASEKWCWNRLWCEIDGICLNFWTYPQDSNDLPPVLSINFKDCANNDKIEAVGRETCPRARAFAITMNRNENDSADQQSPKTHYIATDTNAELEQWLAELNHIFKFTRGWNL